MKKTLIALLVILILGLIYYVTLGSSQLVEAMKKEVNQELMTLQDNGFVLSDRIVEKRTEHFVITLKEPDAIYDYLLQQGVNSSLEDIRLLRDQQVGVDIQYLPSARDAIAMDIYPLNLPPVVYETSEPSDQESIAILEKMINDKVFLVHVAMNKLGNAFAGYVQDIDESFMMEGNTTRIVTQGWTFEGELDNHRLTRASQRLQQLQYQIQSIISLQLANLTTTLESTPEQNQTLTYALDKVEILSDAPDENFSIRLLGLEGLSHDKQNDTLANHRSQFLIHTIDVNSDTTQQTIERVMMDVALNNLNTQAIEKIAAFEYDDNDANQSMEQLYPLLQELTASDTSIDIHSLSVTSITENNATYQGFDLSGHAQIDKQFDWNALNDNPMQIASLFNLKANLIVSNEIAAMLSEDPKLMLMMMVIQPKELNGSKVYELDYTNGSLKINGNPLF